MSKSILTPIKLARIATDPVGSTASLYYNSTTNTVKFYNGTTWITLLAGNNASLFWRYTATGGENALSGLDSGSQTLLYTAGYEQVFLNGVMLIRGTDYTASDGSTVTLASSLISGDYVVVVAVVSAALAAAGYAPIASPTFTGIVTLPLTTAGYLTTTSGGVISSVATIPNAGLTNSSITINGTPVSLGGSITVSASGGGTTTNPLTIGTGLSGTSFNGSTAVTIANTGVLSINGSTGVITGIITSSTTSLPNVTSVNSTSIPSSSNLVTSVDSSLSIPTQTSNTGKYLTTNGSILSWATVSGGSSFGNLDGGLASSTYGGVTSIDAGTA